ncbi:LacI family DNA-binding transcriptional regulator [Aeromicrobium sp. IC_218]|uniref:LacI family DNA-binding transcriptional regulator n=1 Tax=Aeromicrobium sp. IC_218 TaxID=2545468 RepID=UPI00103E02EC|nr:LacI family DNA-binding transcriptional regulator [Aeromicrobium sp. IC_218]TCI96368.1 LacI family transcriptional regulator [Aeromicrobium sp. IC_218]
MAKGTGRVTSVDVARHAGVSQTTVSRTFRQDPRVLPNTRKRVLQAADELGYYPNLVARSLITTRSGIIAVTVPDVENPVFTAIITSLHEVLQARNLKMMLFLERNFEQGPHDVLATGLPVDGVIIASANRHSPVVGEIQARRIPALLMQRDVDGVDIDRVMPDNAQGCRAIADHLVSLGHTRIGMITGSPFTSSGSGRHKRFEEALAGHGLAMDSRHVMTSPPTFTDSAEVVERFLDLPDLPTAVFCSSDAIAVSLLDKCRRLGIEVPRDLSVVGFDDIGPAAWTSMNLTTVRQDIASQCEIAVMMLMGRVEGLDHSATAVDSPVELIVRGSTGPPRSVSPGDGAHHRAGAPRPGDDGVSDEDDAG